MRLSKMLFFLCFSPTIKFQAGSPVDPLFEPPAHPPFFDSTFSKKKFIVISASLTLVAHHCCIAVTPVALSLQNVAHTVLPALLQKLVVGDLFLGGGKFGGNFAGCFLDLQNKGSKISGKNSEHFL